jgi:hypothetical protein
LVRCDVLGDTVQSSKKSNRRRGLSSLPFCSSDGGRDHCMAWHGNLEQDRPDSCGTGIVRTIELFVRLEHDINRKERNWSTAEETLSTRIP